MSPISPPWGYYPPMVKARSSENEKGKYLRLMELADVQDSKSCGEIREGSIPSPKTSRIMRVTIFKGLLKRKRKGGNPEQTDICGDDADRMRHIGLKNRHARYIVGSNPTLRTIYNIY